jgi:hypothetical protein
MHIYYIFRYTESEEKRTSDLMLTFIPFKHFDLLFSRVGARTGAAGVGSKFPPDDAAPQHCLFI